MKLNVKPVSVNDVFQGRRFRNKHYDQYEKTLLFLLPKLTLPEPPYKLQIVWGFSSKAADIDNPCKPFIDCLQKKYGFNDKHIFELNIKKEIVPKGAEYIDFQITTAK